MRTPNLLSGPLPWNPSWKNCLAADKLWRRFSPAAPCHRAERRNNKLSTYIADTTLLGFLLVEAAQRAAQINPEWRPRYIRLAVGRHKSIATDAMRRHLAVRFHWMSRGRIGACQG